MQKSIGKLLCSESDCLSHKILLCSDSDCVSHKNEDATEFVHGTKLAAECDDCQEETKGCKCDDNIEQDLTSAGNGIDLEHSGGADSSFGHSVINMIGALIGLGQLSTPYALENGGWASSLFLVALGITCAYSSCLLAKCLDKNPKSRRYTDIGQDAFKTKGRVIASIFVYTEIFMTLVSYTISLHDNIITIFAGSRFSLPWLHVSTSELLTMIAVLIALPSMWIRNLSSISFLSSAGIFISFLIFTSVALVAILGQVKANHTIPVLQSQNIPAISGLYFFTYSNHVVFADLYKSMKDPAMFTKVSIVSYTAVTILYISLAFMGAKLFGPQVSSQITLSMPPHLIITKIALWATVLTPMTKYALEFAPFAMQLEQCLPTSMADRTKMIVRGIAGSILLIVILALALLVPFFEHVLSLTGSLVSISISVVLPCAFYCKICWVEMGKPVRILNLALIAFGSVFGVIGTLSSSKSIIRSLQRAHSR